MCFWPSLACRSIWRENGAKKNHQRRKVVPEDIAEKPTFTQRVKYWKDEKSMYMYKSRRVSESGPSVILRKSHCHGMCQVRSCLIPAMENRHVCLCSLSPRGSTAWNCNKNVCSGTLQGHRWNVFINLPLNNFCPLSLTLRFKLFPWGLLSTNPELYTKALWRSEMCQKLTFGWSWIRTDSEEAAAEVIEVI